MNRNIDLRNHPLHATKLAARILKFNFEMLEEWPLAITGYNHGPYGVQKLVKRLQSKDIGEIIQTGDGPRFGFASRNFYVSFLAAMIVEAQSEKYFPNLERNTPIEVQPLKLKQAIFFSDLVQIFQGDRELAQKLNPHLQRECYNDRILLDEKSQLAIPANLEVQAQELLAKLGPREMIQRPLPSLSPSPSLRRTRTLSSVRTRKSFSYSVKKKKYRVSRGDTLYSIARHLGVSVSELLDVNDLKGQGVIKAGQWIKLP